MKVFSCNIRQHQNQTTTNCAISSQMMTTDLPIPLFLEITNPKTQISTICMVDDFIDLEGNVIFLSPVVMSYIKCDYIDTITVKIFTGHLNRASTIYCQPDDPIFYKSKNPTKLITKCLDKSHILKKGYRLPITLKLKSNNQTSDKIFKLTVVHLLDQHNQTIELVEIGESNLNILIQPAPQPPQPPQPPLYNSSKKWVPFCGWGYVLSSGKTVKGVSQ